MTTPLDTAPIVARLAGYQQYVEGRTVLGLRARYIDDVGALLGEIERLRAYIQEIRAHLMDEIRSGTCDLPPQPHGGPDFGYDTYIEPDE